MRKLLFLISVLVAFSADAQELNARVSVNALQVSNNVNKNTFRTLETSLTQFLNGRKWTKEAYAPNERIDCTFFLNLESTDELNVYRGQLTIQAARPIFNTSYISPLINFKDDDILFKYAEFQILEYNDNRVTGSDPLVSNLTALFAYYSYMIIGVDNESFALRGGNEEFVKARNIVQNAPDGRGIKGWRQFDGLRNRYWLIDNLMNERFAVFHDIYYNYYRSGLDKFYEDETAARTEIVNVLNLLAAFNNENPNTMVNQFFMQGKASEFIRIFAKASPQEKARAAEILPRIDINNTAAYQEVLKQ